MFRGSEAYAYNNQQKVNYKLKVACVGSFGNTVHVCLWSVAIFSVLVGAISAGCGEPQQLTQHAINCWTLCSYTVLSYRRMQVWMNNDSWCQCIIEYITDRQLPTAVHIWCAVACRYLHYCMSCRRRKMYCGLTCLVCLSAAVCPHYCTHLDVTWGSGRGCPLVVHYWANLQSVRRLHCYGNITRTIVTSLHPSRDMTT